MLLLFVFLAGVPAGVERTGANALYIPLALSPVISPSARARLIDCHYDVHVRWFFLFVMK